MYKKKIPKLIWVTIHFLPKFVVCNYCLRRGQTLLGDYHLESAKVMSDIECNQDLNQITVATCEEILGTTEAPVTEAPATAAPTVGAAEASAPETEASVGGRLF